MIEIIRETTKRKVKPYYELTIDYMIGDANGDTIETMDIGKDDAKGLETVEKVIKILNKLKPPKGRWGIILDIYKLKDNLRDKQITEEEYDFLSKVSSEYYYLENTLPDILREKGHTDEEIETLVEEASENDEEIGYFQYIFKGETEYSFLVYQGVSLVYYDETGVKRETRIR